MVNLHMLKYSIRVLLIAVTFVAMACAALKYSSTTWQQITLTFVLALLIGSVLFAAAVKRPVRWICLGFGAAGWLYFGVVLSDSVGMGSYYLLTDNALRALQERTHWGEPKTTSKGEYVIMYDDHVVLFHYPRLGGIEPLGKQLSYSEAERRGLLVHSYSPHSLPNLDCFHNIGQLCWTIVFAIAGGSFTSWVRRRWGEQAA